MEEQQGRSGQNTQNPRLLLRILMQNRPNATLQRGGDTVVMERLGEELRGLGAEVDIDLSGKVALQNYDLVHIFNFATPEITEAYARNAHQAGVPYVVTTLYEDLPCFFHQKIALFQVLVEYISRGQPRDQWEALLESLKTVVPAPRWENSWTATHAAALIATGEREKLSLLRDYPQLRNIHLSHVGCDVSDNVDNGELFYRETGIKDPILCVGRLETRKNQLMLLKAFEDVDLPIVFITGGFTYQKEYEEACKRFSRHGKTIYLGRVSAELLASAYRAARVHALPSFYELPGIVSLEAARYGTSVVVTDYGTARDYFGESAYYCNPRSAESIRNAVLAAYYAPKPTGLENRVRRLTWNNAAREVIAVYQRVVQPKTASSAAETDPQFFNKLMSTQVESAAVAVEKTSSLVGKIPQTIQATTSPDQASVQANELCDAGDALLRSGNGDAALLKYQQAIALSSQCIRAHRSCGVVFLTKESPQHAELYFRAALAICHNESKSLTGLATCRALAGDREEAFTILEQALASDPNNATAIHKLLELAYMLERYQELVTVLDRYLTANPANLGMKYCLAGCAYKLKNYQKAKSLVSEILAADPTNARAKELQQMLEQQERTTAPSGITQHHHSGVDEQLANLELERKQQHYPLVIVEAERILSAADADGNQKALAHILIAEAHAQTNNLHLADQHFRAAEGNDMHRTRALVGRGVVHAAMDRWQDAEACFTKATTLDARNDTALAGLGVCAAQSGNPQQAWRYFLQALELNLDNKRALLGVIQLGYHLKRLTELESVLGRYLDLHPADLSMLYAYAGCCYAQGKRDAASSQLEKIRIFDPNHQLANELMAKISSEGHDVGEGGSYRSV